MSAKKIITAAIIFAALLFYVVFFDKKIKGTRERDLESDLVYVLPDDAKITRISLKKFTLQYDKGQGKWMILKPFIFPASEKDSDIFSETLRDLRFERKVEKSKFTKKQIEEIGLGKNAIKLVFTYEYEGKKKSQKKVLFVGSQTPVGKLCYMMPEKSDCIYTVPVELRDYCTAKIEKFAMKKIFEEPDLDSIKEISLNTRKGEFVFGRLCDDFKFLMKKPFKAFLDKKEFGKVVYKIRNLEIAKFVNLPMIKKIDGTIAVKNGEKKELEYFNDKKKAKFIGKLEKYNIYFELKNNYVADIESFSADSKVFSKHVVSLDNSDVRKIEVSFNGLNKKYVLINSAKDSKSRELVWDYAKGKDFMSCDYMPPILAMNLLMINIDKYKKKASGNLTLFADIKYFTKFKKEKLFEVKIYKDDKGNMYSTLDNKLYGVLSGLDIRFLTMLKKGKSIKELKEGH